MKFEFQLDDKIADMIESGRQPHSVWRVLFDAGWQ